MHISWGTGLAIQVRRWVPPLGSADAILHTSYGCVAADKASLANLDHGCLLLGAVHPEPHPLLPRFRVDVCVVLDK
jgi:hypothetical protein